MDNYVKAGFLYSVKLDCTLMIWAIIQAFTVLEGLWDPATGLMQVNQYK